MTINSTASRISHATDGVSTVFPFPYRFLANADLVVLLVNNSTGVSTTLVLTTNYTVTGAGGPSGGNVTTVSTYPSGSTLVIYRDPVQTQLLDLVKNDAFPPDSVESALDKLTMIAQRFKDIFSRAITFPDSYTGSASGALPSPAALRFLRWKSDASALENADIGTLGAVGLPIAVVDGGTGATTAADARTNLGAAPTASPTFTGAVTMTGATVVVPTVAAADNDTSAASTAFVQGELASGRNVNVPVRQTVLSGALTAGVPSALTTGSGLLPGLDASPTPLAVAFANGFSARGQVDLVSIVSADAATIGSALPANNTSFIYADYSSDTAVTWGQTLTAPQYGETFERSQGALLHFNGADASTSIIDDWGNTWTAAGNAQLDTAQFQFGTSALLLDGTGDYVECTSAANRFQAFEGSGGWTAECWVRWGTLPTAGNRQFIFSAAEAGAASSALVVSLVNTAGTYNLRTTLGSDFGTPTIANDDASSAVVVVINTWYHVAITRDKLAGTYKLYFQGVEVDTWTSALEISMPNRVRIGGSVLTAGSEFNGWVDEFRLSKNCRYPAGTTFTPSAAAFVIDPVSFYSKPASNMYEVTAASASAGTDPTLTQRNRVFVGEVDTGGASVSAVRTYAYRGRYEAETTMPASTATATFNHNVGAEPLRAQIRMVSIVADATGVQGRTYPYNQYNGSIPCPSYTQAGRNQILVTANTGFLFIDNADGSFENGTATRWRLRLAAERGW